LHTAAKRVNRLLRWQKNDAADAAGICEAVTRPSMRFTGVRTLENQAALLHHKTRELLVAQRTQLINALRGHLAEIGVIAAQGLKNARELAGVIKAEGDETIPACVRTALAPLVRQLHALDLEIACSDRTIAAMARDDEMACRLMTIPGLGPVTASAMAVRALSHYRKLHAMDFSLRDIMPRRRLRAMSASPRPERLDAFLPM
jgi:transposase